MNRSQENSQKESLLRHLQALSYPRFPGTAGEKRAAEYIADYLRQQGLEVELQNFEISTASYTLMPFVFTVAFSVLILLPGYLRLRAPWLSAVFCLLLLAFVVRSTHWSRSLEKFLDFPFLRKISSANVIGRLPSVETLANVVFVAHYDSKSQLFPLIIRTPLYTLIFSGALLLALAGVGILPSLSGGSPWALWIHRVLMSGGYVLIFFLWLQFLNLSRNRSPGAMDNASGVAVMLELARFARETLEPGACLWFVATGAEEVGLGGAARFIQKNRHHLAPSESRVINLDSVGGNGILNIFDRCGFPPSSTCRTLSRELLEVARAEGVPVRFAWIGTGAAFDHLAFSIYGIEGVTMAHFGVSRALALIHTSGDVPGNLSIEGMESAFRICARYLRRKYSGGNPSQEMIQSL